MGNSPRLASLVLWAAFRLTNSSNMLASWIQTSLYCSPPGGDIAVSDSKTSRLQQPTFAHCYKRHPEKNQSSRSKGIVVYFHKLSKPVRGLQENFLVYSLTIEQLQFGPTSWTHLDDPVLSFSLTLYFCKIGRAHV